MKNFLFNRRIFFKTFFQVTFASKNCMFIEFCIKEMYMHKICIFCRFIIILSVTLTGYVIFAHICFGTHLAALSSIGGSFRYCFTFMLGSFDFDGMQEVEPILAPLFFVIFVVMFSFIYVNIFFAIIDRYFELSFLYSCWMGIMIR